MDEGQRTRTYDALQNEQPRTAFKFVPIKAAER